MRVLGHWTLRSSYLFETLGEGDKYKNWVQKKGLYFILLEMDGAKGASKNWEH